MNPAGTSRQQAAAATPAQGAPGTTSGTAASSAARAYGKELSILTLESSIKVLLTTSIYQFSVLE